MNKKLRVLDLMSNEIGDSGAAALAESLKENETLQIVKKSAGKK